MKKVIRILVPLLLAALIIASIGWYLFEYDRDFTRDFLLTQARYNDLHGNSRLSSWFYDLAYDFSGHDENVAIELANLYKADGNYTKAEYTLTTAINSEPTVELFTALCKTYVEQDKLLDAVALLDKITDPQIKAEIEAQRPDAPISDHEPGYYSQYIDVTLYAAGKLYYTTTGEYPSIADPVYTAPISLPAGETTIYAIAVGDNGLVSPLTILGYTITGVIEEVTFADPAMEAALREATGTREGDPVYTSQLWQLTEFTVPEDTKTYTDLTFLPYLEKLTIANQHIDTLANLASLAKLKELDLSGSRFDADELSVLASLPSLTKLSMANCGLSTVEKLAGAQSLTELDLSENTVRNLEPLSAMTTLTSLNLRHNAVTSLSALNGLGNLQTLDVAYNALTSLAPIATCVRLTQLLADNNQLTALDGVDNLQLLSRLSVSYNALTDVSLLSANTGLTDLNIANNTITDISALSTLVGLQKFDFSANQIAALPEWPDGCKLETIDGSHNALTSLDNLSKMQSLVYVYMDYNQITNIDSLANCYCLVQVNVFGNEIKDVSALREHDIIVNYDPT
ncbi:MAG: leucine-rich repeat domain-containing protein [Firmicutes bacterium]|nr:leucine-rich repeat domain-containing protein [Bacillota bacterium]